MPNKTSMHPHANKNALFLTLSFSIIFALIFIALSVVIYQINSTNTEVNKIVSANNAKTRSLVAMQISARERSLALYRMVNQSDPFDRDDTFMEFRDYARTFIKARKQFMAMPLSEKETALIKKQGKLSQLAVPLQNKITELLNVERFKKAAELLITQSIPAQNAVLSEIEKLINYQSFNNDQIIQQLQHNIQREVITISTTGAAILLLTIGIAFFGTRYISRTEKKLFIEKKLAQTTLNSIADGVITVNKDHFIQTINPIAEKLTGFKYNDVLGENILKLYQNCETQDKTKISQTLTHTEHSLFDLSLTHTDGSHYEIEHTVAPIIDEHNNTLGAVIVLRDVTEVRSLEKRLSYQASHDALTGLINRREFEVRLNQMIRNAQTEQTEHSFCYLDLDKFKIINDTAGHTAGDEFLKQVSKVIHSSLRKTDVLARIGGDEFAILLNCCSISRAKIISQQIIHDINNMAFSWQQYTFESGVSIGITAINQHSGSAENIVNGVDEACYKAKHNGRNQVQVFNEGD